MHSRFANKKIIGILIIGLVVFITSRVQGHVVADTVAPLYRGVLQRLIDAEVRQALEKQATAEEVYQQVAAIEKKQLQALLRRDEESIVTTAVLIRPNASLYDVIVIDAGERDGITVGAEVYAYDTIRIGTVTSVGSATAHVALHSTAGKVFSAYAQDPGIAVTLHGAGNGAFRIIVPQEIAIPEGTAIITNDTIPYTIAITGRSISEERDSFKHILAKSPVNVYSLRYVQVKK